MNLLIKKLSLRILKENKLIFLDGKKKIKILQKVYKSQSINLIN